MEKFSIESKVVYTIKTVDGDFEAVGSKGLEAYCENIMGAFIDRMSANRSGNPIRAAQSDFEFLIKHRADLELIYSVMDQVSTITKPVSVPPSCDDFYCERCGTSSGIEYVGN